MENMHKRGNRAPGLWVTGISFVPDSGEEANIG